MNKLWTVLRGGTPDIEGVGRLVDTTGLLMSAADVAAMSALTGGSVEDSERILWMVLSSSLGDRARAVDPHNTYRDKAVGRPDRTPRSMSSMLSAVGDVTVSSDLTEVWEAGFPADRIAALVISVAERSYAGS